MSTEYDDILHKKLFEDSHSKLAVTSTDHGDFNTSLTCLLNLLSEFILFSLFLAGLLFPLITIFSGLFFNYAIKLLDCLILLSNKLDQMWPWLIIQGLHILLNKLHVLLAAYFEEEIKAFAYFYRVIRYESIAFFASYTIKMSFERCNFLVCQKVSKTFVCCFKYIFIEHDYKRFLQELSTTLSRLVLPGKLISDTPAETCSVQCTDTTASYNNQCNALLLNNYPESTHCDYETVSFETACVSKDDLDFNENASISEKDIKQESVLSNINSDNAKQLQIVPKPTSQQPCNLNSLIFDEHSITFCVCDNDYVKYQSSHLPLVKSKVDKQTTAKDHW